MSLSNRSRREQALSIRLEAARLANARPHPTHLANQDELRFRNPPPDNTHSHIASFTKGLPHDYNTGLLSDSDHFQLFVRAIDSADERDIADIPLGPQHLPEHTRFPSAIAQNPPADVRAWESMGAGSTFDLQGPDAQAVTMPPAPQLDSPELVAEMTELYSMALVRDVPFTHFDTDPAVAHAVRHMNATAWIASASSPPPSLTDPERRRLRGPLTTATIFRGIATGDCVGPYISQFLLAGTHGIANAATPQQGFVAYGAARIDQRVRLAEPQRDYMTTWQAWLDVQNGADVRARDVFVDDQFRFITTPRDLATYVHFDALYQAYLTACLVMLDSRVPFDAGLPFLRDDDIDKQQPFATFGPPHILALLTEVSTRALKAVRFQKFNLHRRPRPEALGGLIERFHKEPDNPLFAGVQPLYEGLSKDLLDRVAQLNALQNSTLSDNGVPRYNDCDPDGYVLRSVETRLLPMAFPEGSPMHPSYGAGHAAVAGACVTILKAFFDHTAELPFAFVPSSDGSKLISVLDQLDAPLTVEGELNKVCSNISTGRNWAGVHYFTDYWESIRLGEEIALGVLEEQKLTYSENFSMAVPLFDGTVRRI